MLGERVLLDYIADRAPSVSLTESGTTVKVVGT